jgi:hypothetical protein
VWLKKCSNKVVFNSFVEHFTPRLGPFFSCAAAIRLGALLQDRKMHRENNSRKQFAARPIELAAALGAKRFSVHESGCKMHKVIISDGRNIKALLACDARRGEKLIALRASDEMLLAAFSRAATNLLDGLIIFAFV